MSYPRLGGLLKSAGNGLAFFAAFAAVCWAIRAALPFPEVPAVHAKLTHLADHINEYDTLLIGSSRIYHQIVPSLFDQLMAEQGRPTHTFNAGIDGMRPPEDSFVLDQILRMHPRKLQLVVVELAGLRTVVDEDKKNTVRAVYWHDWERLVLLARRAFYQKKERSLKEMLAELRDPFLAWLDHVELFARNMTNMGRAEIFTRNLQGSGPTPVLWAAVGERRDGYIGAGRAEEMTPEAKKSYEEELEARRKKPALKDLGDPISQLALARVVAKIRAMGATPVLIVPPTTNKKNFFPDPKIVGSALVFDFSDFQRYPGLYENKNRQDTDHVNAAGAQLFTRLVVEKLAPALNQKQ